MQTKEVQHALAQVILLNGFQSNPNKPGVEKLVACTTQSTWLYKSASQIKSSEIEGTAGLLDPGRVFLVKGWNRSVCMMSILFSSFEDPEILKDHLISCFGLVRYLRPIGH